MSGLSPLPVRVRRASAGTASGMGFARAASIAFSSAVTASSTCASTVTAASADVGTAAAALACRRQHCNRGRSAPCLSGHSAGTSASLRTLSPDSSPTDGPAAPPLAPLSASLPTNGPAALSPAPSPTDGPVAPPPAPPTSSPTVATVSCAALSPRPLFPVPLSAPPGSWRCYCRPLQEFTDVRYCDEYGLEWCAKCYASRCRCEPELRDRSRALSLPLPPSLHPRFSPRPPLAFARAYSFYRDLAPAIPWPQSP